jgi:hypothetical protein
MRKILRSFLFISSLGLAACASTSKREASPFTQVPSLPRIDYLAIQNRLGLDMSPAETGFKEQKFDACDLGPALSELNEPILNCHHAYFAVIQFQLSCRASDQPSSILSESDLSPVSNQAIQWKVGKISGDTQTDYRGQGTIRAISGNSMKNNFLRISTGTDFLMMRAGQAAAIVTPPAWCPR